MNQCNRIYSISEQNNSNNTLDVIGESLEGNLADVEDFEAQDKLKTIRHLVQEVNQVQQRHDEFDEAIETVVSDHDVVRNLRTLEYLN